jgi:Mn-containing catalase
MRGPWTSSFGLHLVDSQIVEGKGLSVGDIDGKIDGEDRGKQDDAQKAATSPGAEAIGKAKSMRGGDAKSTSSKRHS